MKVHAADYDLLQCDERPTGLGPALRIRIHRKDKRPMSFRELWEVFQMAYPGRWALQVFPPAHQLVDQAHKYHLYVFDDEPLGLNLLAPHPDGTKRAAEDAPPGWLD